MFQLDRVGLDSEPQIPGRGGGGGGGPVLRAAQSHNDLFATGISVDSPATSQRKKVESKEKKRGLLGLFKRKTVTGRRGRKGKERKEEEEEEEEGEEGGRGGDEGPSFLTASVSMPNIAGI